MKNYQDIKKDITDAQEEMVATANKAILDSGSYIAAIVNKVLMSSGNLKYPYTDVGAHDATTYLVKGLNLVKSHDFTSHLITDETIEDANPAVGISNALATMAAQTVHKKVEKGLIDAIVADSNVVGPTITAVDWAGIQGVITSMGADVFTTVGKFHVVLGLVDYMKVISESATDNAMKVLKDKVVLHVSEFVATGSIIAFHEHGVAGAINIKSVELDNQPAKNAAELISAYTVAYNWDVKYIKKASI